MITSTVPDQRFLLRRTKIALATIFGLLILLGLLQGQSVERTLGYLIVLSAAILPSMLWMRMGAHGIPVLPTMALAYIPYFAWPILSGLESTLDYTSSDMLRAALTVALYLVTATAIWRLLVGMVRSQDFEPLNPTHRIFLIRFTSTGLCVGILFHGFIMFGGLGFFGSYFGLVRSIAITFILVACYLTGAGRASRLIQDKEWRAALVGVGLIVLFAWSSLFLVGGLMYILACGMGYVTITRRIPWFSLAAIVLAVAILHAGKAEMRSKYWMTDTNWGQAFSVSELPKFAVEWVSAGISATFAVGQEDSNVQSIFDRASLLQMILLAQRDTPDVVDYLNGETYAFLPSVLVPRFIVPDKPASQVAMNLLNVRYGVMSEEGTDVTAIGWGLVAEAYANFGNLGVIGMALLIGAYCAALSNWSANAKVISIPSMLSISSLILVINLESDFIQLFLPLLQSFASVLIFYKLYTTFAHDAPKRL